MIDIFTQYTIVSNIVQHISWEDLNNFKKINLFCRGICEREEVRRCYGICFGFVKLENNKKVIINRKRHYINKSVSKLKKNFQCKNPKLVLIMSNGNDKKSLLEEILTNQCNSTSIICYVYYHHGNIGSTRVDGVNKLEMNYSFSRHHPSFSWMCLPEDVDAQILTGESPELSAQTKLVLIFNTEHSRAKYPTSRLGSTDILISDPVNHAGALVKRIEVYQHESQKFGRLQHISLAIGGANFMLHPVVIDENCVDEVELRPIFAEMKADNERLWSSHSIKYQCVLVLSCYSRESIWPVTEQGVTEYELFAEYFPHTPVSGIICRAQMFHTDSRVITFTQCLHDDDWEGMRSIYLILTWTG